MLNISKKTLVISCLFAATLLLQMALRNNTQFISMNYYDFLQKTWPLSTQNPKIAVVEVTQATLDSIRESTGFSWPLPREYYGALSIAAQHLKAQALALDIIFDEESKYGVADDLKANELFKKSGMRLIFPSSNKSGSIRPANSQLIQGITNIEFGSVEATPDSDGIFRNSTPLSLGNQLVKGVSRTQAPDAAQHRIRFYEDQTISHVDFFHLIQLAQELLEGGTPDTKNFESLKGRYWIVGYSAPGLLDIKATSIDPRAPGMSMHAHQAQNILDNIQVQNPSAWLFFSSHLFALFIVLLGLLYLSRPMQSLLIVSFSTLIGALSIPVYAWSQHSAFLDPFVLGSGMFALGILGLSYRFQSEWKERLLMARSLETSMSKEIVAMIRDGKMSINRFGERKKISVLFSDLSGFTSISETMDPISLVNTLNLYLEEVVEVIFKHKGFVDKFIGDAVMALWGAPLVDQHNHAELALRTALDFESAVQRFNQKVKDKYPTLSTQFYARVGAHLGEAVVGNMGSLNRHNYTAIGDNVNLASRLEGMGKNYDVYLIVSEDILNEAPILKDKFFFVDEIMVKGKTKPTKIYTSFNSEFSTQDVAKHLKAFDLYAKEKWKEAIELWSSCKTLSFREVFIERCQDALVNGVPKQFKKGVWAYDTK